MKHTQTNLNSAIPFLKGTLIIAGVATDGVIIAADSRGSYGTKDDLIGYVDKLPKIYLLNNKFPIAVAGQTDINDKLVSEIVSEFNQKENRTKDIKESFEDFQKYLLGLSKDFPQKFIEGGYYNGIPHIFNLSKDLVEGTPNTFLASDSAANIYLAPFTKSILPSKKLQIIFPNVIEKFAKETGKENHIGGPISVVKILPNNKIKWMANNFSNTQINDINDYVDSVKSGVLKFVPAPNWTREDAIKRMEENPNYKPKQKSTF